MGGRQIADGQEWVLPWFALGDTRRLASDGAAAGFAHVPAGLSCRAFDGQLRLPCLLLCRPWACDLIVNRRSSMCCGLVFWEGIR